MKLVFREVKFTAILYVSPIYFVIYWIPYPQNKKCDFQVSYLQFCEIGETENFRGKDRFVLLLLFLFVFISFMGMGYLLSIIFYFTNCFLS